MRTLDRRVKDTDDGTIQRVYVTVTARHIQDWANRREFFWQFWRLPLHRVRIQKVRVDVRGKISVLTADTVEITLDADNHQSFVCQAGDLNIWHVIGHRFAMGNYTGVLNVSPTDVRVQITSRQQHL